MILGTVEIDTKFIVVAGGLGLVGALGFGCRVLFLEGGRVGGLRDLPGLEVRMQGFCDYVFVFFVLLLFVSLLFFVC